MPIASSQSPSSGDHYLVMRYEDIQAHTNHQHTYVRTLLAGNDSHFVILFVDAGFVIDMANKPREVHGVPTLADICDEVHCVLLHPSTSNEPYVLIRDAQNKIIKDEPDPADPTAIENSVKFTRLFRTPMEQIHSTLKSRFRFLDSPHIVNSILFGLSPQMIRRFGLPDSYSNVSKLAYIVVVCCSMINRTHPGYGVLYIDPSDHVPAAQRLLTRLFMKNPLLHDIWPREIKFDKSSTYWTSSTFGALSNQDTINFPRLEIHQINPIATDIASGPHALKQSFSLATYMGQLKIKEQRMNLSTQEAQQHLLNFPFDWEVDYCHVRAPPNFVPSSQCPQWSPEWWDQSKFGPWPGDLCFVRARIPPSNKSATSRANYHYAVIGFSQEPSDRLRLLPPYNRIVMWRCFRCPALNGCLSMCRHLGVLLMGCSFPQAYKSTFRPANLLNTVAEVRRQTTTILPPTPTSQPIPDNIPRRSSNWRATNPLYDSSTTNPVTSTPPQPASVSPAVTTATSPATPPTVTLTVAPPPSVAAVAAPVSVTSTSPTAVAAVSPPVATVSTAGIAAASTSSTSPITASTTRSSIDDQIRALLIAEGKNSCYY